MEVEVDVETGKVQVMRVVASHDGGRIVGYKIPVARALVRRALETLTDSAGTVTRP